MTQTFKGRTEDAEAPFLSADFWEPKKFISGEVLRSFDTQNGRAFVVKLDKPVKLGEEEESQISIGAMKGFEMAVQASGAGSLQKGDAIQLKCTGKEPAKKAGHSPRVNFELVVARKEVADDEAEMYR